MGVSQATNLLLLGIGRDQDVPFTVAADQIPAIISITKCAQIWKIRG